MANDFLMQIWGAGQISLQQLLQAGNFPFADELLQNLQSQQEQLQNGEMPQGLSPEIAAQVQNGANKEAVDRLHQAMSGRQMVAADTA